ncbi:MFS transporter [Williamsia sp. 1135]|uniref:MFS transporter n=1 Tax=Williamsia sp. 1135 TaxID=1889262 RepID=UPI000A102129|nr:MFS transporter [Williamsia sp. 1135]ORM30181.1 MFS transporter [Williamsia sp. 1135]
MMTMSPTTQKPINTRAVMIVVCLALAAVVAAMSSLNVALPDIARSTHASQTQLSWIIDAYSLIFASLLLPAGAIGDRYGRRKTLLAGLAIFGVASIVAMTAGSASELIGLRGLMGLGAALVMPATLSTITSTFPDDKRPQAVGVWAGVAGGSAILGLLASGTLLEFFSWRSVFGLNVALAAIAIVAAWRVVPESADASAPKLDLIGAALSVAGLVVVVYSIIEAPEAGWLSARTLAGIVGGLVILALFILFELRTANPMLNPRIFARRGLSAGSLSIFMQFFAFFGFIFVVLQYLQMVRGDSPLISAVSMLPLAAVMMPSARLAPRLTEKFGSRPVCVVGLVLVSAGLLVLSRLDVTSSYWLLLAGLIPLGIGMGTAMTPATSAITGALPRAQQGVASAMNDLSREVGGALGIAVLGSVLTQGYRNNLELPQVPAELLEKARESFAGASHAGGQIAAHADVAFASGMQSALLLASIAVLAAALAVGLLMPKTAD